MWNSTLWVDNEAHLLHLNGRIFPCDRDIETLAKWNNHALLLSSDTDCLSLWDQDGLIRTARVGVYPQDIAISADTAYVCGGADGMLHALHLPDLQETAEFLLPGMPERVCIRGESAYVLLLRAEADVQTALLTLDLSTGVYSEIVRFPGLPGAIALDENGLWVCVNELVCHIPEGTDVPDSVIEGFGLVRWMTVQENVLLALDPLEGLVARITRKPRPAVEVLYRGDVERRLLPT